MTATNDLILSELNQLNLPSLSLTSTNVSLGDPTTDPSDSTYSLVPLNSIAGRGYYGTVDIRFQRVDVSVLFANVTLQSTATFTPDLIIAMLNAQFKLTLVVSDFEAFTIPTLALLESTTITLISDPDSLVVVNSATITLTADRVLLPTAIGSGILRTLTQPIPVDYHQCARAALWGADFTCIRDAIKPIGDQYTNFAAVQTMVAALGVAAFAAGSITDYATSAIPDSNQSFQRVIVQSGTMSNGITGPVYLHYNILEQEV